MKFKDFFFLTEEKGPNFCYMVYAESPYIEYVDAMRKTLGIQAEKLVKPEQFHCTIRYTKLNAGQTPLAFLEWLADQELPELTAFTEKYSMFDGGSLVMELDSPELHEWFNKVNSMMSHLGYLPSDFPTFKPHLSLSYGTTTPLPKFDIRQHRIKIKFTKHVVTNQNKEVIFERHCDRMKSICATQK